MLKKAVFLDYSTMGPGGLDRSVLNHPQLDWVFYDKTSQEEIQQRIQGAQIVVSNKAYLGEDTIHKSESLEYIVIAATGTNNIDLQSAEKRNIPVSNVRSYATASVVQHTFSLILALKTNLKTYVDAVRDHQWNKSEQFCLLDFPIDEIAGKTLGIIGYGTLGKAVAATAKCFGLNILIAESLSGHSQENRTPIEDLLKQSDIISLHCPLTRQTENLFTRKEFAQMKPTALIINTARGGIINEQDLVDALTTGQIAGAGIDVLSKEPPDETQPLLSYTKPNLLLTPHCAWGSRQSRQRLLNGICENIHAFLEGKHINAV